MKYSELKPWQKVIADACRKDPELVTFLRLVVDGGVSPAESKAAKKTADTKR